MEKKHKERNIFRSLSIMRNLTAAGFLLFYLAKLETFPEVRR